MPCTPPTVDPLDLLRRSRAALLSLARAVETGRSVKVRAAEARRLAAEVGRVLGSEK